jgi:hypothetical protein
MQVYVARIFCCRLFFPLCQELAVPELLLCWHHDLAVKLLCYVGTIIIIYRHVIHFFVKLETTLQFAPDNYFVVLIFEFLLFLVLDI